MYWNYHRNQTRLLPKETPQVWVPLPPSLSSILSSSSFFLFLPPSLSSRPLILHIPSSLLRPSYFFSFLPCKYLSPPSLTFLLSPLSLTFLLSPLSLTFLLPPPSYLPVRCSPMAALDLRLEYKVSTRMLHETPTEDTL